MSALAPTFVAPLLPHEIDALPPELAARIRATIDAEVDAARAEFDADDDDWFNP